MVRQFVDQVEGLRGGQVAGRGSNGPLTHRRGVGELKEEVDETAGVMPDVPVLNDGVARVVDGHLSPGVVHQSAAVVHAGQPNGNCVARGVISCCPAVLISTSEGLTDALGLMDRFIQADAEELDGFQGMNGQDGLRRAIAAAAAHQTDRQLAVKAERNVQLYRNDAYGTIVFDLAVAVARDDKAGHLPRCWTGMTFSW